MGEGPYLESLIQKWLLDNNHRVDVVMSPDQSFVALQEAAERKKLDAIDAILLPADRFDCHPPASPAAVPAAAAA
jgi:Zn-dependent M16 (insulinase) family peptidase